MYGYLTLEDKLEIDRKVRKEFKSISNMMTRKGRPLIFESGCVNVKVTSLELVLEDYSHHCIELLIHTEYDEERKPIIRVSGEDLHKKKVKIVKDRKYKTISLLKLDR